MELKCLIWAMHINQWPTTNRVVNCSLLTTVAEFIREAQLFGFMKVDLSSVVCPHDVFTSYALKDNWCRLSGSSILAYISEWQLRTNLKDLTIKNSNKLSYNEHASLCWDYMYIFNHFFILFRKNFLFLLNSWQIGLLLFWFLHVFEFRGEHLGSGEYKSIPVSR